MKTASDANAWLREIDRIGHISQVNIILAPSATIFTFKFNSSIGILEIPRLPKAPVSAHLSRLPVKLDECAGLDNLFKLPNFCSQHNVK